MNKEEYGDMRRAEARDLDAQTAFNQKLQEAALRLHYWRKGGDNFTSYLYTLMMKADMHNFERLSLGFPIEAIAFSSWRDAPTEREFFRSHGLYILEGQEDSL